MSFPNLIEKAYADVNTTIYTGTPISADKLLQNILDNIVNPVIILMLAVAIIYFLWGMFEFVRNAESSDERKKGAQNMLWGAIGLFIMVTAYGIIHLIYGTLGINK